MANKLRLKDRGIAFLKDVISFIIYILTFFRKKGTKVVVVYHSVGYVDANEDPWKINISPGDFERHLKVLSRYKDRVTITFDDGYGNNFKNAFPLLKKYNLSAMVFLTTDFIDGNINPEKFDGRNLKEPPLTWDEVKVMDGAGIKFGSHSKTHRPLTALSEDELRREALDSKKRIEEVLGHRIDGFSYPFGGSDTFNELTKKVIAESGYDYAYTNIMGCSPVEPDDKFALRRIRIYGDDGPFRLKMKISGAYDWVDIFVAMRRAMCQSNS